MPRKTRQTPTDAGSKHRPEDGLVLDSTGKRNGRGAYLCEEPACWQRAVERNLLAVALKIELSEADRAMILAHQPAVISAET